MKLNKVEFSSACELKKNQVQVQEILVRTALDFQYEPSEKSQQPKVPITETVPGPTNQHEYVLAFYTTITECQVGFTHLYVGCSSHTFTKCLYDHVHSDRASAFFNTYKREFLIFSYCPRFEAEINLGSECLSCVLL